MNLSRPFVQRPIATVLLTLGLMLAGIAGFLQLPVAPLPQLDFPVISVSAAIPGASPATMASSVATPLERRLGMIAGVNEMTSRSGVGASRVTLQFELGRNIDAAAREVQAAINASRVDLPSTLRSNPSYRKVNPASAPVIILALTSQTKTPGQIYDAVSNILSQRLSQVAGVGEVEIGGGSLPAVRVELLPLALHRYGISTEDVRAALQATNARRPQGALQGEGRTLAIYTQAPGLYASDYAPLVVVWRNGAAVRLSDVAQVRDGVEDSRTLGLFNGKPAVVVLVTRQPGANIIETVDGVRALLPELQAQLPTDVLLHVASDSTNSIRSSLRDVGLSLALAVILVVLVVGLFLRSLRSAVVPAVATIASLLGTFGVMHLLGFSLNNLSLMALTVATGFVVDDAIVVLENTSRHTEAGLPRLQAALLGAREVGVTVLSISLSLVAVFIPLLFMDGLVGRLLREFALTLSVAVLISLLISLTTTPMLCAWLLPGRASNPAVNPTANPSPGGRLARWVSRRYAALLQHYARSLDWALAHQRLVLALLLAVVGLNVYLYQAVPKGFFPQQDSGQIVAGLRADQSISSQALAAKMRAVVDTIHADPAVDTVVGFSGGTRAGGGFLFVNLKPRRQRQEGGLAVIARLRPQLAQVTGLRVFLNPVQDFRSGGRSSNSSYQYSLKSDNQADLRTWALKLAEEMKGAAVLSDIDTDQQDNGVQALVQIDQDSAQRLGLNARAINSALYNAFGQRQIAKIYTELNQYPVVMEWAPAYTRSPQALGDVYVPSSLSACADPTANASASALSPTRQANACAGLALGNSVRHLVPLSSVATFSEGAVASSVSHEDGELATTISFNLAPGASLDDARAAIEQAQANIGMPGNVRGVFAGTALSAQQSQGQQLLLVAAALVAVYIVLGVLYESLVHPITVLSTLPSAGIGALLALLLFRLEFSVIALIGVLLLIGIVKKNAILIIDFALQAERTRGLSPQQAVREACLLRFRPILMTTLAAALGALPLAIGFGEGAELRRPLGIAIIGGLVVSQLLTLLTTPVVYLLLDKLRRRSAHEQGLGRSPTKSEIAP